jgi:mRNA interferase YafQ
MKGIRRTAQFKQDVKRLQRQGKDLAKLRTALESLADGEGPAPELRDHVLVGQYKGTRECHLEPDWLLIYERAESEIVLIRTGSHSDLFR